jgi:hypothetical protein
MASKPPGNPFRNQLNQALNKPRDPRAGLQKPVDHAARSQLHHKNFVFNDPMTHQQWMKATDGGRMKPRSLRLRSVDKAVRNWTPASKDSLPTLQFALTNWMVHKKDWKTSIRNQHNAVEILKQQAFKGFAGGGGQYPVWLPELSKAEMNALAFQIGASIDLFDRYFLRDGEPLTMELKWKVVAKEAAGEGRKLYGELKKSSGGQQASSTSTAADSNSVKNAFANLLGANSLTDEYLSDPWVKAQFAAEFGRSATELVSDIADMVPVLSSLTGGVKTVVAWGKAGKKTYEIKSFGNKTAKIQAGDMRAAYGTFMGLVKKDAAKAVASAVQSTVKLILDSTTQGAAAAGTGPAKALGKLAARIFTFGLQVKEQYEFNRVVKSPDKSERKQLLAKSPFAACMLLAHAGTSDVLSFGAYMFGSLRWQDDVDTLIKSVVRPVQSKAKGFADEYPFTIPNFHGTKLIT